VRWSESAIGAITTTLGVNLVTSAFSWFLNSGLSRHNMIYGSLGAVIAFMYWVYIINVVIFFGAHISASVSHHHSQK
jgi:membrane protein